VRSPALEHARLHPEAAPADHSGDAGRRRVHLPDAAADAVRSRRDHRRRQCHRRAGGADQEPARPRPADAAAVRDLDRQGVSRRFWRELLLQEDGGRTDRRAHRADPVAGLFHHHHRRARRRSARGAGGASPGHLGRSPGDGFFGAGLFGADLRGRLHPDLCLRSLAELAAGAGLSAHQRGVLGLGRAADPARADALGDLYRA
jgi:hypothetical protein